MLLNLEFDSNAQAAPQSFRDGVQAAADLIDAAFADAITVNIAVGYGEITTGGTTTTLTGGLSEAAPEPGQFFSYSTIRADLAKSVDSAVASGVSALPLASSIQGQNRVVVWTAQEKALGLISTTAQGLDGAVGFSAGIAANELVGVALHELTHAMGRTGYGGPQPDIFDLYRFSSQGARLFGNADPTAPASYFSLNNGATDLADYGQSSDPSDYLSSGRTPHDPFNEFYSPSTIQALTPVDILQMEALGFHTQPSGPPSVPLAATDLVFRNITTGDWGFMRPTGGSQVWHAVGSSSTAYQAIGTADFNNDGLFDVAFRNTSTGDWGFLTAQASGGESWQAAGASSLDYAVAALADFNGDGATDVAFRSATTGDLGYMTLHPGGGETWHPVGSTSTAYATMGAGDFNHDGIMDIAFRQTATGDWGYMSVNPGGGESWHPAGPSSTAYSPIGTGDFNGDGVSDVAFRNNATGDWGFMTASSGGETWHPVGPTSLAYDAVKVADFNNDGLDDIAFRNPLTGDWGYMSFNPSGGELWHAVGTSSTAYLAVA